MQTLTLTSCQAPSAEPTCRALAAYLDDCLGVPVRYVDDISWQERYRCIATGDIDIAWICGLPYVRLADLPQPPVELLAAPVMRASRYRGAPIYFSDVVVRADSAFRAFADLQGRRWAINEPNSQSGCGVVGWYLASRGLDWRFFGQVIASGSHQRSLHMILAGDVDASAIDSTVLETLLEQDPALAGRIRRLEPLGPSPIPPWVVSRRLPPALRHELRQALLTMHATPSGRSILHGGGISRFAAVGDIDYGVIRTMASIAATAGPLPGKE